MSILKLHEFEKPRRGPKSKIYMASWNAADQSTRYWRSDSIVLEKRMKLNPRELYFQFKEGNNIFVGGPYNRIYKCNPFKFVDLFEKVNGEIYQFDECFHIYKKARYKNKKLTLYKYILVLETLAEL